MNETEREQMRAQYAQELAAAQAAAEDHATAQERRRNGQATPAEVNQANARRLQAEARADATRLAMQRGPYSVIG